MLLVFLFSVLSCFLCVVSFLVLVCSMCGWCNSLIGMMIVVCFFLLGLLKFRLSVICFEVIVI